MFLKEKQLGKSRFLINSNRDQEKNNCQPRIVCPAKLLLKIEGKIKTIFSVQTIREYTTL